VYFDAENGQLTNNHCANSIWRTELILKIISWLQLGAKLSD